uniref:Uncharacterized protein n=1 Tax=Setaria viridis TaxID=4556 RepID=A0A4U6V9H1_SETVI|nr:hypothetical protein SEVIR_3G071600v2 [Setaria viridis]
MAVRGAHGGTGLAEVTGGYSAGSPPAHRRRPRNIFDKAPGPKPGSFCKYFWIQYLRKPPFSTCGGAKLASCPAAGARPRRVPSADGPAPPPPPERVAIDIPATAVTPPVVLILGGVPSPPWTSPPPARGPSSSVPRTRRASVPSSGRWSRTCGSRTCCWPRRRWWRQRWSGARPRSCSSSWCSSPACSRRRCSSSGKRRRSRRRRSFLKAGIRLATQLLRGRAEAGRAELDEQRPDAEGGQRPPMRTSRGRGRAARRNVGCGGRTADGGWR